MLRLRPSRLNLDLRANAAGRLCLALLAMTAGVAFGAEQRIARGEYLVNLLGCARCHTEGYLLGNDASGPYLAGSTVGIAYTDGDPESAPGLVFARNLTPDEATGLGAWSERDIVRALVTGVGIDGHQRLPVMPWPNYGALAEDDLQAIAAYLKSVPAVSRQIPATTSQGGQAQHPYVRFGFFIFEPFDEESEAEHPR